METIQYRTSGVVDESTFREVNKVVLSRQVIWGIRIIAVISAAFTLGTLIAQNYIYAAVFALFTVFLIWLPRRVLKTSLDNAVRQLRQAHPDGAMRMETWFTGEGVTLHNLGSGAQMVLPYAVLRNVAETERYFYLVAKTSQTTLVFKERLTPEERTAFLPFLQEKCPKLKVIR